MNSIRGRLTLRLAFFINLLTVTACVLLYMYVRGELLRQFDADLFSRAHTLASLLRIERDGRLDMDYSDASMPEYLPGRHVDYFEAILPDRTVLERSLSLKGSDLADPRSVAATQRTWDLTLPDGRAGRAMLLMATPFYDSDDRDEKKSSEKIAPRMPQNQVPRIMFIAARSRSYVNHISSVLAWALGILALSLAGACVVVARVTVARGLKPIDRVAAQAALIGPQTLEYRFEVSSLPAELRPICLCLNDLLARLDDAFARERRVNADIAHELRTPIAELRSLTEVAARWPEDASQTSAYLRDAHEISLRMQSLVESLLALARSQASRAELALTHVEVAPVVESCLAKSRAEIDRRRLTLKVELDAGLFVSTDQAIFTRIIDNLISNASHYAAEGGAIDVMAERVADSGCTLTISNTNDSLAPGDIEKLFDPFWRKDPARTDGSRLGLGLTLVKQYGELLDIAITMKLTRKDRLEIALRIPGCTPPKLKTASQAAQIN